MTSQALRLRRAIEAFHSIAYFAPEVRSHYVDDLGMHPWASYFAQRAAAMGRVGPEVVAATFYGFSPRLVAKSIPSVWDHVPPPEAIRLRLTGVDRALHRMLETAVATPDVTEALDLARRASQAIEPAGHPLAAAHAGLEEPDEPHVALWHHVTVLREYRGDGHVAVLVSEGLGPVASLVTAEGFGDFPVASYRRLRGWSEDEWEVGVERCRSAGWVREDLSLTDAGRELRTRVEDRTDRTMSAPLAALGDEGLSRLIDLMKPLSRKIVEGGGIG